MTSPPHHLSKHYSSPRRLSSHESYALLVLTQSSWGSLEAAARATSPGEAQIYSGFFLIYLQEMFPPEEDLNLWSLFWIISRKLYLQSSVFFPVDGLTSPVVQIPLIVKVLSKANRQIPPVQRNSKTYPVSPNITQQITTIWNYYETHATVFMSVYLHHSQQLITGYSDLLCALYECLELITGIQL